jgi:hypothetical protein
MEAFPFLMCLKLATENDDESLDQQVFRKKMHTEQLFNAESYHHVAQMMGVLNTLATS